MVNKLSWYRWDTCGLPSIGECPECGSDDLYLYCTTFAYDGLTVWCIECTLAIGTLTIDDDGTPPYVEWCSDMFLYASDWTVPLTTCTCRMCLDNAED